MTQPMDVKDMELQRMIQENAQLKDAMNVLQTRVQSYAQTANEMLSANIELKTGVTLLQKQTRDAMEGKKLVEKELADAMAKIHALQNPPVAPCAAVADSSLDEPCQAANG